MSMSTFCCHLSGAVLGQKCNKLNAELYQSDLGGAGR